VISAEVGGSRIQLKPAETGVAHFDLVVFAQYPDALSQGLKNGISSVCAVTGFSVNIVMSMILMVWSSIQ
jgi:hypothetical protein